MLVISRGSPRVRARSGPRCVAFVRGRTVSRCNILSRGRATFSLLFFSPFLFFPLFLTFLFFPSRNRDRRRIRGYRVTRNARWPDFLLRKTKSSLSIASRTGAIVARLYESVASLRSGVARDPYQGVRCNPNERRKNVSRAGKPWIIPTLEV